jgi:hypothetical protein
MVSDRQRIESAHLAVADNPIPPPTYEESNATDIHASQHSSFYRSVENATLFLGEVISLCLSFLLKLVFCVVGILLVLKKTSLTCSCQQVIQAFQAETDVELSLAAGDYVVVRQVFFHAFI